MNFSNRANCWVEKGDYDRAIADLDEAIIIAPTNAKYVKRRQSAGRRNGTWTKRLPITVRRSRSTRKTAMHSANGPSCWLGKQEYDQAIHDYGEAIALDLNDTHLLNQRAMCWLNKKEYGKALADFDQSLAVHPKNPETFGYRAAHWFQRREFDKAIADHSAALEIDPAHLFSLQNRAMCWIEKNEHDRAIADYNELLRLVPNDSASLIQRAHAGFIKTITTKRQLT